MRFNSNIVYFVPQSDHIDLTMQAGKAGPTKKDMVYRFLLGADAYMKFSNDNTEVVPADGTKGVLLKANQEYFISAGDNYFMIFSRAIVTATDNVIEAAHL